MRRIEKTWSFVLSSALMVVWSGLALAQNGQTTAQTAALPDSPSAVQAASVTQNQNDASSQSSQPSSQSSIQVDEQKPERPVGTAVAEAPLVSGTPVAQPAGVAAAPGKQRRVRTIVLRVGAIVGAGVAIGATVALTAGTPSKPPGAH